MALSDLSPEELQIVQNTLLAPPPTAFSQGATTGGIGQGMEISPALRAAGESGFLGAGGRFIESLARIQDKKRAMSLAQDIDSLTGLEPDFLDRARKIYLKDPEAASSPIVQRAFQLADAKREEAVKKMEEAAGAQLFSTLYGASEEDIQKFQASGSPYAYKYRQQAKEALENRAMTDELLSKFPDQMRQKLAGKSLPGLKAEYNKFSGTLPQTLRNRSLDEQKTMAQLAKRFQALRKIEKDADYVAPPEGLQSDSIRNEMAGYLFKDPNKAGVYVTDESLNFIAKAADKLLSAEDIKFFQDVEQEVDTDAEKIQKDIANER